MILGKTQVLVLEEVYKRTKLSLARSPSSSVAFINAESLAAKVASQIEGDSAHSRKIANARRSIKKLASVGVLAYKEHNQGWIYLRDTNLLKNATYRGWNKKDEVTAIEPIKPDFKAEALDSKSLEEVIGAKPWLVAMNVAAIAMSITALIY